MLKHDLYLHVYVDISYSHDYLWRNCSGNKLKKGPESLGGMP